MKTDTGSDTLRRILTDLPRTIPVEELDRIWIFPVRALGARQSGLVVVSTRPAGDLEGPRRVLTLRYETDPKKNAPYTAALTEQGSAPADLIQRIIEGVIRRVGDDAGEPVPHEIAGEPGRWAAVLDSLAGVEVDRPSGE